MIEATVFVALEDDEEYTYSSIEELIELNMEEMHRIYGTSHITYTKEDSRFLFFQNTHLARIVTVRQ